jgi:hypothetical protein
MLSGCLGADFQKRKSELSLLALHDPAQWYHLAGLEQTNQEKRPKQVLDSSFSIFY